MKRLCVVVMVLIAAGVFASGTSSQESIDRGKVNDQQSHYASVHPIPYFDYSIPRDVYTQIYEVQTTKAYMTYSVIESITGQTFFHGPSVGYGIPADTSITNPLQKSGSSYGYTSIGQAEPNGLFSSQNTDGTWVLFVLADGSVAPIYTEHKVTTFPFNVKKTTEGWVRSDDAPVEFTVIVK